MNGHQRAPRRDQRLAYGIAQRLDSVGTGGWPGSGGTLARNVAVAASLLLQHGCPVETGGPHACRLEETDRPAAITALPCHWQGYLAARIQ
jgi:hypothetical protein